MITILTYRIIATVLLLGVTVFSNATMYGVFYGWNGNNLHCPENDVTDLATLYRRNGGNVLLIRGDGVNRQNVLGALQRQANAAQAEDILIFAYSGHGNSSHIACGSGSSVAFKEIKAIFNSCRAKRKVIIIDACLSGNFGNDGMLDIKNGDNAIAITSARQNESSFESRLSRNSIFFTKLLKGLKGKADDNNDGRITAKELYNFLKPSFFSMPKQHCTMKGRFSDNMLLYTYDKPKH